MSILPSFETPTGVHYSSGAGLASYGNTAAAHSESAVLPGLSRNHRLIPTLKEHVQAAVLLIRPDMAEAPVAATKSVAADGLDAFALKNLPQVGGDDVAQGGATVDLRFELFDHFIIKAQGNPAPRGLLSMDVHFCRSPAPGGQRALHPHRRRQQASIKGMGIGSITPPLYRGAG